MNDPYHSCSIRLNLVFKNECDGNYRESERKTNLNSISFGTDWMVEITKLLTIARETYVLVWFR